MPGPIGKRMLNYANMPTEGETFEGPSKTLTDAHFLLFPALTGDVHPVHYDVEYAKTTRFEKPLAHGGAARILQDQPADLDPRARRGPAAQGRAHRDLRGCGPALMTRLLIAALALCAGCAGAQNFPNRPVRIVVPYPPAGSVDFVARSLQAKLQEILRQPVIVENRAGASGTIGSDLVAKAAPDGYTLLLGGTQTHAMNVGMIRNMPYDPVRDFTPITQTTRADWVLAADPSIGVATPSDLVAASRARPGHFSYASSGIGSAAHLAFSMLAAELGLNLIHVPYKGIAQGVTDTVSGRVSFVMGDQSTLLPHVRGGRLKAIAMTGNVRSTAIPELPTLAETIAPGFDIQAWQGIWGPPGMSAELARSINAAIVATLRAQETADRLRAAGVEPVGSSVDEFAEFVKREVGRWVAAARKANVEPE